MVNNNMKPLTYFLDQLAKENSCNSWKYYYEKNKRSARSIREMEEEANKRFELQNK